MILFLFFLFLFTPLVEIAVFIEVGGALGLWPTLAIVILTAMLGTALFRIQGLATLRQAQASLAANRFPVEEVFDGLCLLAAGALLITPGFVTDSLGFLLFLPPFRTFLRGLIARRLLRHGRIQAWPEETNGKARTIEGVYREVDEDETKRPPDGPDRSRGD